MMLELRGKKVLVFGLGVNGGGLGVARFMLERGAEVRVTDLKTAAQLGSSLQELGGYQVGYTLGEHKREDFEWADLIVRNQAVPRESEWLRLARDLGKPVEMEVSLFFQLCPSQHTIGITGTKGKTTTTTLTGAIMQAWRPDTVVGGNISGQPPLSLLPHIKEDTWVVLELSSWQLEGTDEIGVSPHIAAWLNLSPDHLNRYRDMDDYAEAKFAIFKHQRAGDFAILNVDDPIVRRYEPQLPGGVRPLWFGEMIECDSQGAYLAGDRIVLDYVKSGLGKVDWQFAGPPTLPGRHNLLNAAVAALISSLAGVDAATINSTMAAFAGVADRMEPVREIAGVRFINDTTSTTPASTVANLTATPGPVKLLAGGSDKRLEFGGLAAYLATRADVAVYLLAGSATAKMQHALEQAGVQPAGLFDNFALAIQAAYDDAVAGDTVLLSPATASFGMFSNEFERGAQFRQIVKGLTPTLLSSVSGEQKNEEAKLWRPLWSGAGRPQT